MTSLADRFRRWYEYERDCNAKTLTMLASVPADRRGTPQFERAVGRMAHLVAASGRADLVDRVDVQAQAVRPQSLLRRKPQLRIIRPRRAQLIDQDEEDVGTWACDHRRPPA